MTKRMAQKAEPLQRGSERNPRSMGTRHRGPGHPRASALRTLPFLQHPASDILKHLEIIRGRTHNPFFNAKSEDSFTALSPVSGRGCLPKLKIFLARNLLQEHS